MQATAAHKAAGTRDSFTGDDQVTRRRSSTRGLMNIEYSIPINSSKPTEGTRGLLNINYGELYRSMVSMCMKNNSICFFLSSTFF